MENHKRHPRRIEVTELLDWIINFTVISAAVNHFLLFQKLIVSIFSWRKKQKGVFYYGNFWNLLQNSCAILLYKCWPSDTAVLQQTWGDAGAGWQGFLLFLALLWITQEMSLLQTEWRARKWLTLILCHWQMQERKVVNWETDQSF